MSSIHNRIVTTFTANGGNAIAVMNQIHSGMMGVGTGARQIGREVGPLERQFRALGTTIRYALAGGVVFGAVRMVNVLRDTQRQLALIRFLGDFDDTFGGYDRASEKISQTYNAIQEGAMEALVPVDELSAGVINLYSSIESTGRAPDEMVAMTTLIAQGAQFAQVPTEDLTRAVTGMNQAFGNTHNIANYERTVASFVNLVSRAPGGAAFGPAFIQQMAPLAAVSRFANIDQAAMMGLYLTTLRTGGSPATAGRGLQYLLQSIAVPQSDEADAALRQAGITPESVQQRGGLWALKQVMTHAQGLGMSRKDRTRIANMSEDEMGMLEGMDAQHQARALGVSGPGLAWMSEAIGRIHGIRALVALMAQGEQMNTDIANSQESVNNAHQTLAKSWESFARDQPLQAAAIAIDNIRRQMIEAAEPFLDAVARGVGFGGKQAILHRREAQIGVGVLAGGAAIAGLARLGVRGFSGFAGRGLVAAKALEDSATQGGMGLGASPQHPIYTVVVGQLFGGGTGGISTGQKVPPVIPAPGGASNKRFGIAALGAAGLIGAGGAELGLLAAGQFPKGHAESDPLMNLLPRGKLQQALREMHQRPNTDRSRRLREIFAPLREGATIGGMRRAEEQIEALSRADNNRQARLMRNVIRQNRVRGMGELAGRAMEPLRGQAVLEMDVNLRHPDGSTERVHVPLEMDIWSGGRAPQFRGGTAAGRGRGAGAAASRTPRRPNVPGRGN